MCRKRRGRAVYDTVSDAEEETDWAEAPPHDQGCTTVAVANYAGAAIALIGAGLVATAVFDAYLSSSARHRASVVVRTRAAAPSLASPGAKSIISSFMAADAKGTCCIDDCSYSKDGTCDDGGAGAVL